MEPPQSERDLGALLRQIENLKSGIREISHEINNPLGILRMAVYFLENTQPTAEKQAHYFKVINEGLERIEQSLDQLKSLRENPSARIHEDPPESA